MTDSTLPIRIVLCQTSHPGNIGAVARAMKNMGLSELHLVKPCEYRDYEAYARASGADDLLDTAVVHQDLQSAINDCGLVFGTSARPRHVPFMPLEPRECAAQSVNAARAGNRVAILFGSERTGLQNDELLKCHHLVTIPTSDEYSSLNIAMAVQIIAYELLLATRNERSSSVATKEPLATSEELERLYEHLSHVLEGTHFRDHSRSSHVMAKVRRIFNRAQIDQNEMRILRGILSAVQEGKP
jgi:tRNA (cytidine32/uridine32-2'-O)-methyltransferase